MTTTYSSRQISTERRHLAGTLEAIAGQRTVVDALLRAIDPLRHGNEMVEQALADARSLLAEYERDELLTRQAIALLTAR